jgi:hypothetical protein
MSPKSFPVVFAIARVAADGPRGVTVVPNAGAARDRAVIRGARFGAPGG